MFSSTSLVVWALGTLALVLPLVLGSSSHTVAVISDIHLNPFYNASYGPNAACVSFAGVPPAGAPTNVTEIGQVGCDPSPLLFQITMSSLCSAVKQERPDFLIMLGDFIPHVMDIWQSYFHASTQQVQQLMESIITKVSLSLDSLHIPVYPVMGNNDIYPDYDQSGSGPQPWLKQLSLMWSSFLDSSRGGVNASATFAAGGYYRVDLPHLDLSLLMLNTNAFSSSNTIINCASVSDPDGVFAWMAAQLADLEQKQRSVWICGHIPPSVNHYTLTENWQSCYLEQYFSLIDQYSDVVGAQLYAHEHVDLFRATNTTAPLLLHGSVSPIYGALPTFRIYSQSSNHPIGMQDYREYSFNGLTGGATDSYTSYFDSVVSEYQLSNISSESIRTFASTLQSNSTLWSLYWKNSVASAPVVPTCDNQCVHVQLCEMLYCDWSSFQTCVNSATLM